MLRFLIHIDINSNSRHRFIGIFTQLIALSIYFKLTHIFFGIFATFNIDIFLEQLVLFTAHKKPNSYCHQSMHYKYKST